MTHVNEVVIIIIIIDSKHYIFYDNHYKNKTIDEWYVCLLKETEESNE